jgi:hypothetical protein
MTERDRAVRDLRRDVIDHIAASAPVGATTSEVVSAIVESLGQGLPDLVEVEVIASCPYGNMPRSAGAGHWRDWHRGHGCNLDPKAP